MEDITFWKKSLMCIDVCNAAYEDGDAARQLVRQHVLDYDEFAQFSVGTSQVTCIKNLDTEYVIAFRGTDDKEAMLLDLKTWQTSSETDGQVHYGFKKYVDDIEQNVLNWLESYSVLEQKKPIVVTGHSLGAAAATIFITRLKAMGYENLSLYTYGSPRVGDRNWAKQFDDIEAYRFVNNNDIVCRVPFGFGWYIHVGKLFYVNYAGEFVNYTPWSRAWDRFRSRIRALAKFQVFDGTYDHPGIYYKARIYEHLQRLKSYKKS